MPLATLTIDLEARLATLQQSMNKAVSISEGSARRISSAFTAASSVLAAFGTTIGAGFLVAGFKNVVAGVDALNDLQSAVGGTIKGLSALEDIAARGGGGLDTVSTALMKLTQQLNAAADPASEAARMFKALGLNVRELQQMDDPSERLRKVAIALDRFANDAARGQFNVALLGKSTRETAKFIEDLANAGPLNGPVTEKQAADVKKFNDELASLTKTMTDFWRNLAGPVVSEINRVVGILKKASAEGTLTKTIIFGPGQFREGGATGSWDTEADSAAKPSLKGKLSGVFGGTPKAAKQTDFADLMKLSDSMSSALRAIEDTDVAKIRSVNAQIEELLKLGSIPGIGGDASIDAAIRRLREELVKLDPEALRIKETKAAVDELLGIGADSSFQKSLDKMTELGKRLDEGRVSTDAYIAALGELDGAFKKAFDSAEKAANDSSEEIGLVFASAAGKAITEWKGFGDVLKGIGQDLLQIGVKSSITDPLSKLISGGVQSGGGGIGGLFSWLFSALPKFASGIDYVPRDMPAIVHRGERIIPAGQNAGGVHLTQIINVGAGVGRHEVAAAMVAARDSAVSAVVNARRRGMAAAA